MNGQYAHNIDAKGRLFIPTKLRDELGGTLHVTVGQDHCLSVFSDQGWADFNASLKGAKPGDAVMLLVRRNEQTQFLAVTVPKDAPASE